MYATAGPNNTRGAVGSAGQGISTNYFNYGAFNAATGAGSATSYDGRGINPYVYGEGGGYGDQGGRYTGPTGETIINYTYGQNDAGPHAVTSRSNGDAFAYDANGNMTSRIMSGVTWTHTFDAENRLVEVDDGTTETTYIYDAGGNRIKRIVDDGTTVTTTLYVAGMEIELEGSTETQRTIYYNAGGAFRIIGGDDAGLYFRHGDHLGSTSVLSDSTGAKVEGSDVVYAPFGEVRTGELSDLTDFGFTGQRNDGSTGGLMYYHARYYLPELRRFISADTIVPSPIDPQAFNRYSYVLNNPIMYIDPFGFKPARDWRGYWYDDERLPDLPLEIAAPKMEAVLRDEYEIELTTDGDAEDWTPQEVMEVYISVTETVKANFGGDIDLFKANTYLNAFEKCTGCGLQYVDGTIHFPDYSLSDDNLSALTEDLKQGDSEFSSGQQALRFAIAHEIGHSWADGEPAVFLANFLADDRMITKFGYENCDSFGTCLFKGSWKVLGFGVGVATQSYSPQIQMYFLFYLPDPKGERGGTDGPLWQEEALCDDFAAHVFLPDALTTNQQFWFDNMVWLPYVDPDFRNLTE